MKKEFIDKMKKKLLEEKAHILSTLAGQSEQIKGIIEGGEAGDVADIASDVVDRTLLDSLGAQDAQRLTKINSALDRISQGKYGICISCGKAIPEARLEILPYTGLCVACKGGEERKNR